MDPQTAMMIQALMGQQQQQPGMGTVPGAATNPEVQMMMEAARRPRPPVSPPTPLPPSPFDELGRLAVAPEMLGPGVPIHEAFARKPTRGKPKPTPTPLPPSPFDEV